MEEIILNFNYNGQEVKMQCKINENMNEIFKRYANKINTDINNIYFINNGTIIKNNDKKLEEINNKDNIMNILVYDINTPDKNTINIIFLYESETIVKKRCKKKDKVRDICMRFAQEIGINDFMTIIFMYGGMELNLDRTFIELASEYDKSCNGMTILVYKKTNPLIVNFLYKNKSDKIKCSKNDKLYNICLFYALKNKLKFEKLFFYYQKSQINWFQTFNDLLIQNNTNINETQSNEIMNFDELEKNYEEIEITVEYCCAPCCIINKCKIIGWSIGLFLLVMVPILLLFIL